MGINGIEKLKPDPKPTIEELRKQVREEFPYKVGSGTFVTCQRTTRLKELMREHGYDTQTFFMDNGPRS